MIRLIRHIRDYRHVVANFVARDLKVKYRGTAFGYLWSLLEPLSQIAIYWFIFVVITKRGGPDYPLVVVLGILPWTFFSSIIVGGSNAIRSNAGLILRIYMPREVFVISQAATACIVLLLNFVAVIPLVFIYDAQIGVQILLLPVALLLIGSFALGVGLLAACANTIYRDVGYVLSVLLRIGMYVSAVIFPVDMVPERVRYLFLFNPIALSLTLIRCAVTGRPLVFAPEHLLSAALISVLSIVVGSALFQRWEKQAVKYL